MGLAFFEKCFVTMFWCESLPYYRNVMLVCIYTLQQIKQKQEILTVNDFKLVAP